jgi:hypothetical protein
MTDTPHLTVVKNFDEDTEELQRPGVTFQLAGHEFHTKGYTPPAALLNDSRGLYYAVAFLRTVLVPDDRDVFDKLVADPEAPFSGDKLDDIAVWVMGEISGRPTERPASSGDGPEPTSTGSKENSISPVADGDG